jgi:16S rRNA processing protein RimM
VTDREAAQGLLRAGRVGRPHGRDGSFHVIDANPALLALGAQVLVGGEPQRIERRAGNDQRPIVRLEGCDDRDAAQHLRGLELMAQRTEAPVLGEDEWWPEDLEGCAVRDGERRVGRVRRLLALPSCEVLEVEREGGADLLVPLVADAVRSVDTDLREIEIDLQFLGEA